MVRMTDNGSLDMDLEAVNISREEIMQIILDSEQTKKRLQKETNEISLAQAKSKFKMMEP